MAQDLRFDKAKVNLEEMLSYIVNIEQVLDSFKLDTRNFASEMESELSDTAIELVEEISDNVKRLRTVIEERLETGSEGMQKIRLVTNKGVRGILDI